MQVTRKQVKEAAKKVGIEFHQCYTQKRGIKLYYIKLRCKCCGEYVPLTDKRVASRLRALQKEFPNNVIIRLPIRNYFNAVSIVVAHND